MKQLTVGSFFSGIGGLSLGLERAGMRLIWVSEIEPYASAVLKKHHPDLPNHGDICAIDPTKVERPDVLCGGFPCQDISFAGKGAGLAGKRSGLWFEYLRLIEALRPRYAVIENVSALRNRGLDVVLGSLAEIGYDAEWNCIPAAAVGAPHRRDRVWIVAYPQREQLRLESGRSCGTSGTGPALAAIDGEAFAVADADRERECKPRYETETIGDQRDSRLVVSRSGAGQRQREAASDVAEADGERLPQRSEPDCGAPQPRLEASLSHDLGRCGALMADTMRGGCEDGRAESTHIDAGATDPSPVWQWALEPDVGRVADGVPSRVDRLRCLGNSVVPQVAELVGRAVVADYTGAAA